MRTLKLFTAAIVLTLTIPAAAQTRGPAPNGYNDGYGNAPNGYNDGYGNAPNGYNDDYGDAPNGYNDGYGGNDQSYRNDFWPGQVAGNVVGGAVGAAGAIATAPFRAMSGSGSYDTTPDESYCAQRYRSYDPASGTYMGYDGRRHPC